MLVLGAGLAGTLLALELAEGGAQVELAGGPMVSGASGCSYGGVPWWAGADDAFGRLLGAAPAQWSALQDRYGDLGLSSCHLWLHWSAADDPAAVAAARSALATLPQRPPAQHAFTAEELWRAEPLCDGADLAGAVQLPYLQVDPARLQQGAEQALARLGVERSAAVDAAALPQRLEQVDAAVVCAGAFSGSMLQQLGLTPPGQLRFSWAGVLQLERPELSSPIIAMPLLGARRQRELTAGGPPLVLDPGLAPGPAGGLLVGQTSWFDQGLEHPPEPQAEQQRLMAVARQLLPHVAVEAMGRISLHQRAVAYSTDQLPLLGPLQDCSAIHMFTGFSGAFAQVPVLAPLLAGAMLREEWSELNDLGVLCR